MPDAVVAVIELKDGNVGVLPFPRAYRVHIENKLKDSDKLGNFDKLDKFQSIEFPGYHTSTLPSSIRKGNLDELVCEETITIDSDEYPLYIYHANYDEVYRKIRNLS